MFQPNIIFDNMKVFNEISKEKAEEIFNHFVENDCVLINDILTHEIKEYLKNNITFKKHNDIDEPRQFYREHNDEECNEFIKRFNYEIKIFYEFILQRQLTNIIGFSMKYNENSDCKPHYDNYNMPISSTICFYNEDKISYPLYIDKSKFNNPHPFRLTIDDKDGIPEINKIKIDINEGDIGIFRGRNHLHWRDKKYVKDYRAILLHTEDYTYNHKLVSYIFNDKNTIKADINNIKNINTFHLTDLNSYEKFRQDYVMYFNNS
jgi:hypothetical protein